MKKLFLLLLLSVCSLGFTSCSDEPGDDVIYDICPVAFDIKAVTASGTDLLGTDNNPNIDFINKITVIYSGTEYHANDFKAWLNSKASRYYLATFSGLSYSSGRLVFGEFPGDENYKDLTFTVRWPDGAEDVVVYNHKFRWKKGKPDIKSSMTVNGQKATEIKRIFPD